MERRVTNKITGRNEQEVSEWGKTLVGYQVLLRGKSKNNNRMAYELVCTKSTLV